jgi:hypothetical protein
VRDVVTAAQVREAVNRLEKANKGVPLPSPIASWLRMESLIRLAVDGKRVRFDPGSDRILPDSDPALPDGEKRDLDRSPDDRFAAYTRANDLYVFDVEDAREICLTNTGTETSSTAFSPGSTGRSSCGGGRTARSSGGHPAT